MVWDEQKCVLLNNMYDPPRDAVVARTARFSLGAPVDRESEWKDPRENSYDPALHRQSEWEAGAGGAVHDRGEEEESSIAKVGGLLM